MTDLRDYDLRDYLFCAIRAARASGRIQQAHVGTTLEIDTKSGETDLVTHVDKLCETRIRETILAAFPDHAVLGEEQGLGTGEHHRVEQPVGEERPSHRWIVDPIDGTLNYAHGFPFYCTSIALEIDGRVQVGVVYDPNRDELFTATSGGGAFLNGRPLRVTSETVLRRSMLVTGFAYNEERMRRNVEVFARMMPLVRSIRRPGAAALDLSYVAAGRADAFWELGLKPWDVAAGMLIIREAGGTVTGADGGPYRMGDEHVVASNGALHAKLVDALDLTQVIAS